MLNKNVNCNIKLRSENISYGISESSVVKITY